MGNKSPAAVDPKYPIDVAQPSTKNFKSNPLLLKTPPKVSKNLLCFTKLHKKHPKPQSGKDLPLRAACMVSKKFFAHIFLLNLATAPDHPNDAHD
jgi:hypothetical protein